MFGSLVSTVSATAFTFFVVSSRASGFSLSRLRRRRTDKGLPESIQNWRYMSTRSAATSQRDLQCDP